MENRQPRSLRLNRDETLFFGRLIYTALILLLWPLKSPRALSALGSAHFHPPPGPFAMFDSYPPLWAVMALEAIIFVLFALWVAGYGRWMVGLALSLGMTLQCGFFYSAGKIDHDFVILLFPVLITLERPSPKRAIFFCLGVYFASSGLAKIAGGWLDLTTQATLSWALMYAHVFGKTELLLHWSLETLPGWSWELFDQVTVWFELLVPLALLPRFRHWVVLCVPLFHLGTILFFGIDFSRLLLLYLPLALLCTASTSRDAPALLSPPYRKGLVLLCQAGLFLALLHLWITGFAWTLPAPLHPSGLLLFSLFEAGLLAGLVLRRHQGKKRNAKGGAEAPPLKH